MEFSELDQKEKDKLLEIFKFIDGCTPQAAAFLIREIMACHNVKIGKKNADTISVFNEQITLTLKI